MIMCNSVSFQDSKDCDQELEEIFTDSSAFLKVSQKYLTPVNREQVQQNERF